jgi:hypothetical protein
VQNGNDWAGETIAPVIGNGLVHAGVVTDADNHVHVSYYNGQTFSLDYATNANGLWEFEPIDDGTFVGTHSAMTIDDAAVLHVSYSDDGQGDLKYAHNAGGVWQTFVVTADGLVGAWSDLAVASNGQVYIAYTDGGASDIKLAVGNDDDWTLSTIDPEGGTYVALAFDPAGHPHVAYIGAGLRHAYLDGETWQIETVDPGALAAGCDLVTPANNQFAIAYQGVGWNLNLARGDGSGWSIALADGVGNVGAQASLAALGGGKYRLGYLGEAAVWTMATEERN